VSFPAYERYKESGVEWLGRVPSHWLVTRVKDVAEIVNGYPFDSKLFDPEVGKPLVRIRDLNSAEAEVRFAGNADDAYQVTSKELLIGMDGDFNVGRWRGREPALLNQRVCALRTISRVSSRLLELALPDPLKRINDLTYSTTVKHLSSYQVGAIRIALPPVEELDAVVAFLDRETAKIDALVEAQERLIALLKEKRQAVISHAVTKGLDPSAPMKDSGVEWLGQVPAHWEVKQLAKLAKPETTITYGIIQAGPDIEDGIPYIRTSDMSGHELPLEGYLKTSPEIDAAYSRSKVRTGDLVIAIRATIGKPLKVPEHLDGANLTQGTARFSPADDCDADFVRYCLISAGAEAEFERLGKGATFKEITLEMLRKFRVPAPPYSEQKRVARELDAILLDLASLSNAAEAAVILLRERRAALISAAVTGKIDVRGLVQTAEAA